MAAYDVTALSTALEFDTTNGGYKEIVKLPGLDRVAIAWRRSTTLIYVQCFNVNTSTGALTAVGSPLDIEGGTSDGNGISLVCIDASNLAVFWSGPLLDGFCRLLSVDGTGNVSTNGSALEFDTSNGNIMSAVLMDSTHILNIWEGVDDDGFACIFTVNTGAGTITKTGTPLEFATDSLGQSSVSKLSSTKAIVAWQDFSAGSSKMRVLDINTSTWAVTTAGAEFTHGVSNVGTMRTIVMDNTSSPNTFILGWNDRVAASTSLRSYQINTSTWAITAWGSTVNPSSSDATAFEAITMQYLDSTHLIAWYQGSANDGFSRVYTLNNSTGALTTSANEVEFDTADFSKPSSCTMEQDTGWFITAWDGSGSDGYVRAFSVEAAPSGPANLKTYNTNVSANIKTINTNTIANIKSLNTNV